MNLAGLCRVHFLPYTGLALFLRMLYNDQNGKWY